MVSGYISKPLGSSGFQSPPRCVPPAAHLMMAMGASMAPVTSRAKLSSGPTTPLTGCRSTQPSERIFCSRPMQYWKRTFCWGSPRPAKGGNRSMSLTFESEPTMLDWPAKMKTRTGSRAASLGAGSEAARAETTRTGARTAAARKRRIMGRSRFGRAAPGGGGGRDSVAERWVEEVAGDPALGEALAQPLPAASHGALRGVEALGPRPCS